MRIKKTKKRNARKSKMERIMFEKNIDMIEVHDITKLSNPLLFDVYKGRRTKTSQFNDRSLNDLKRFFKLPIEDFLGFEDKSITKKIHDLVFKKKKVEVKKKVATKKKVEVAEKGAVVEEKVEDVTIKD